MWKKEVFNVQNLTRLALVAAMYVALSFLVEPVAYGIINFRVSEVLMILCFYRKDYSISLILGCFIVNLFSPMGLPDIIFGTLATAISAIPMYYMKNVFIAAILPVVINGIVVGIELNIFLSEPLWISIGQVALGEFIILGIGAVIFKFVFEKRPFLLKLIGSTRSIKSKERVSAN